MACLLPPSTHTHLSGHLPGARGPAARELRVGPLQRVASRADTRSQTNRAGALEVVEVVIFAWLLALSAQCLEIHNPGDHIEGCQ